MRDAHSALKAEVIKSVRSGGTEFKLAKLQWSKDEIGYSLHANPNSYSLSGGFQLTDFLHLTGFTSGSCAFFNGQPCFYRWVDPDFDLDKFAQDFAASYSEMGQAEKLLNKCGFLFDSPEGLAHFGYGTNHRYDRGPREMDGDGHTALSHKPMKESEDSSEDALFRYKFTWLETTYGKGWVTHYRAKNPPLSSEIEGALSFLKLQSFQDCPEFDFESCYWKSTAFISRDEHGFDSNAGSAHACFDEHAANFSQGLKHLLGAHGLVEPFGFGFISMPRAAERIEKDIAKKIERPAGQPSGATTGSFDVAISFAGPERKYAKELAEKVNEAGFAVFYDDFYEEELWGKNLTDYFKGIYQDRSRYCVIFVSQEYNDRMWTTHERQSAQARALKQKTEEYILPIKVDNVELEGMPATVAYVSISKGIDQIAEMLIKKLQAKK